MGKSKEIRKRTLLERLAAERAGAVEREKILSGAVNKLRVALVIYAKGENWMEKTTTRSSKWPWSKTGTLEVLWTWVGDGNPEDLAKAAITAVFGKDHPLTGEVK